jgi:hypothetical protein
LYILFVWLKELHRSGDEQNKLKTYERTHHGKTLQYKAYDISDEESNPSGQDYSNRKTQRINGHIPDGHDNIKHMIHCMCLMI